MHKRIIMLCKSFYQQQCFNDIQNKEVDISQQNNYPWDGDLKFTVNPKSSFTFSMLVRIPGWARNEAIPSDLYSFENSSGKKTIININGKEVYYDIRKRLCSIEQDMEKK